MPTTVNAEVLETLDWMIQTFVWQQRTDDANSNEEYGREPNLSPEMRKAQALYEDIKASRIICVRT